MDVIESDIVVQLYSAQHIKTKQPYTLKRLNTKTNVDRDKYQALLNEVSILKQIDHINIVKCHKMLKTSNNIYLVYDYCPALTLKVALQKGVDKNTKGIYIKQICMALREMKRKAVVHLNLTPHNLCIGQNGNIIITGFLYGDLVGVNGDVNVSIIPPQSQFVAPEVLQNKVGSFSSDAYSFGKLLELLDMHKGETENMSEIIESLTKKNPQERMTIQNIETIIVKSSSSQYKSKKTLTATNEFYQSISVGQAKSSNRIGESPLARDSGRNYGGGLSPAIRKSAQNIRRQTSPIKGGSNSNGQVDTGTFTQCILQIMKKRSLSIFFLSLAETCTKAVLNNSASMVLGYLFMKKSTNALNILIIFLQTGKGEGSLRLSDRERVQFFKTNDYLKLCSVLNKQLAAQKKWMTELAITINNQEGDSITQKFRYQLQTLKLDQSYLLNAIESYLKSFLVNEKALKMLQKNILVSMSLMSQIFEFGSYEKLFEDMVNEDVVDFERQTLVVHIKEMDSGDILAGIRKRLKQHGKNTV